MARRNYQQADKGEIYCIDWPEWHVECAHEGCNENLIVSPLGESTTLREAEMAAKKKAEGWRKKGGRWYCPAHVGGNEGTSE